MLSLQGPRLVALIVVVAPHFAGELGVVVGFGERSVAKRPELLDSAVSTVAEGRPKSVSKSRSKY